jgi:hypothetical protein
MKILIITQYVHFDPVVIKIIKMMREAQPGKRPAK